MWKIKNFVKGKSEKWKQGQINLGYNNKKTISID